MMLFQMCVHLETFGWFWLINGDCKAMQYIKISTAESDNRNKQVC